MTFNIVSINDSIRIDYNTSLTTLDFPVTESLASVYLSDNPILSTVNLPVATTLSGSIFVEYNPLLSLLSVPSLVSFLSLDGGFLYFYVVYFINNPSLLVDEAFYNALLDSATGQSGGYSDGETYYSGGYYAYYYDNL